MKNQKELAEVLAAVRTMKNFMNAERETDTRGNCFGLPCGVTCDDCPVDGDLCLQDLIAGSVQIPADILFHRKSDGTPTERERSDEGTTKRGRGAYMDIKGKRCYSIPTPEDFVKDDENMIVEGGYVVTVHKQDEVGGFYILKQIARHAFGNKEPDEDAIKWCIMRYNGEVATVDYEYGLTL